MEKLSSVFGAYDLLNFVPVDIRLSEMLEIILPQAARTPIDQSVDKFAQEAFHKSFGGMIEPKSISALVIEDSDSDFRIIKKTLMLLDTYRVKVHHASNLADARAQILNNDPFDVVLVDFCLGVETGSRVIQELGGRGGHSAVLLVTGMPGQDIIEIALETGALGSINKNQISPSLLESAIRSAMHTHALELKLHNLICDLEQANQTTTDVIAQVYRDLSVPVAALRQYADLLSGDSGLQASRAQREFLKGIQKSTEHLTSLLGELDDRHRDGASANCIAFEICCFDSVVKNALDLAEPQIHEAEHTATLSVGRGRPRIRCQPIVITQAIVSLITKAIDTVEHSGVLSVELATSARQCELRVTAQNSCDASNAHSSSRSTDVSIPQNSQSGLHAPTAQGTSGIRSIIEVHEGELEMKCLPNGGFFAVVRLPLAEQ